MNIKWQPAQHISSAIFLAFCWTAIIGCCWWWNFSTQKETAINFARTAAKKHFEKDNLFRQWIANHGGIYIPVTKDSPPNPYLSFLPERDITDHSGRHLTLVNPASMSRQINELSKTKYNIDAHLTSLAPLSPQNLADDWEANALRGFYKGSDETYSIDSKDGEALFRYMRPLVTEKACLKCHAHQGFKIGNIRGGVSISFPLKEFELLVRPNIQLFSLTNLFVWLIGIIWLYWIAKSNQPLPLSLKITNAFSSPQKAPADKHINVATSTSEEASTKKTHNTRVYRAFFSLFIPLLTLSGIVVSVPLYYEYHNNYVHLKDEQASYVDHISTNIKVNLTSIAADLMFLSSYPELHTLLNSNDMLSRKNAENAFLLFSYKKGLYDQVRYLDENGMEIVRIDYNKGVPQVVPLDKLQNKAKRYYFADTFSLEKGGVYVSPMDLNIERGEVEKPLKPMIRFGSPVYDSKGQKRGVILLNYLAEQLVNNMILSYDTPDGKLMLLNSNGYWLKGDHPDDEWGFMFKDRHDRTFANRYPLEWQKIKAKDSGQFNNEHGLFTFATIYPLIESMRSSTGADQAFTPSQKQIKAREYIWEIVTLIPATAISLNTRNVLLGWGVSYFILLVLLGFTCWRSALNRAQRQEAGLRLEKNEKLYRAVVEEQTELICRYTPEGELTFVNDAMCSYIGQKRQTLLGQNFLDVFRTEDQEQMKEKIVLLSPENPTRTHENKTIMPDGKLTWQHWTDRCIFDQNGQLVECQSVGQDITDRKAAECFREDVELIVRHDLKSPLNGIINFPQIILETPETLTEEQFFYLNLIEESGYRMLHMINSSLDIYKIETGSYVLKAKPINIIQIIHRVIKDLKANESFPKIECIVINNSSELQQESSDTLTIVGDENLSYTLLSNLILNALEASSKGDTVTITLEDGEHVTVSIHNTTVVPSAVRGNFFEKYSTFGKPKGTGIGTYSAKLIATTQGGDIAMSSREEEGTVLTITFPKED